MDLSDKALFVFTVLAMIIIGYYSLRESPAEKATKEYNKQIQMKQAYELNE